jgi:hypothetical protein
VSKTRDTRVRAQHLLNAYIDALVGIFALRLPGVADIVRTHAPEMTVVSSYPGSDLILQAQRVVDECKRSGTELKTSVDQITAAFVAAMWDTLTAHAHYDTIATEPEIQFFRHLRNACGHNGCWNFKELKHPARWRDKELTLNHSVEAVFQGLLKHGDVALLFVDIDKNYFE